MNAAREEIVTIVNREDQVIDALPRSVMREQNLIHRAAYVLVFNDVNELYIQKRSSTKDVYPGYWDIAAGGVVLAGESYLAAAHRELFEELGISGVELVHLLNHFYEDADNMVWGSIYRCVHNGPFILQEAEIDAGRFTPLSLIGELHESEPVIPDGLEILHLLESQNTGSQR
jgi:8-oxo-dGTP pyrophosphatase MutT (NUDIX family)